MYRCKKECIVGILSSFSKQLNKKYKYLKVYCKKEETSSAQNMTLMFGLSCANSTWDGAQKQEKEIKNKARQLHLSLCADCSVSSYLLMSERTKQYSIYPVGGKYSTVVILTSYDSYIRCHGQGCYFVAYKLSGIFEITRDKVVVTSISIYTN